jgi:hypothetical protein
MGGDSTRRHHDLVDETSDGSFPASDPPGWAALHIGAPRQNPDDQNSSASSSENEKRTPRQDKADER